MRTTTTTATAACTTPVGHVVQCLLDFDPQKCAIDTTALHS